MLSAKISTEITDAMRSVFGEQLLSIVSYGSAARGENTPESDIDLALFLSAPMTADQFDTMASWFADAGLRYDMVFSPMILTPLKDFFDYPKPACIFLFILQKGEDLTGLRPFIQASRFLTRRWAAFINLHISSCQKSNSATVTTAIPSPVSFSVSRASLTKNIQNFFLLFLQFLLAIHTILMYN